MLQQFEQALLVVGTAPDDAEKLNAAFRAAHTNKGTAGLFGCDAVVAFTHELETLLEALRAGQLAVTDAISAALLKGRSPEEALPDEVRAGGATAQPSPSPSPAPQSATEAPADPAPVAALRPRCPVQRPGPAGLHPPPGHAGPGERLPHPVQQLPPLPALDAEACRLGCGLRLQADRSREHIERVLGFAVDTWSWAGDRRLGRADGGQRGRPRRPQRAADRHERRGRTQPARDA